MRRLAATALAVAIAAIVSLPAVAQEPSPDPPDPTAAKGLAALAERRWAAAELQLKLARGIVDEVAELRRASRELTSDPRLDHDQHELAVTRAELTDQLFRFEERWLAVVEAAAETIRLAKEAVHARLTANETNDPEDRQTAREAEWAAYESALHALDLAREEFRDVRAAAGVEAALVSLDVNEEGFPVVVDVIKVYAALVEGRRAAVREAVRRARDALFAASQAWILGRRDTGQTPPEADPAPAAPEAGDPSPAPADQPAPAPKAQGADLARLAERRAQIAAMLARIAENLKKKGINALWESPRRAGPKLEAADAAEAGAAKARKLAEAAAAALEAATGNQPAQPEQQEEREPPSGEPAEQPDQQPDGQGTTADGRKDEKPSALLADEPVPLAVPVLEPPGATPEPAGDTGTTDATGTAGAGTEGGATVLPPRPAKAAEPDERGLEAVQPVPARVDQPGKEAGQEDKAPAFAPVPQPGPDEDATAAMEAATAPAFVPGSPPGGRVDPGVDPGIDPDIESGIQPGPGLGADLPTPDGPAGWSRLDLGIAHGPAGTIDPGMQLDLPVQPGEDHHLDIDPPLFPGEPSRGGDIEGGQLGPGSFVPPTGPQPDAGIDFGP